MLTQAAHAQYQRRAFSAAAVALAEGKLFDKILVANRGEIACRVFRTAKKLGIKTVAVYSDADADSLHVSMADEAVNIGPAPTDQSYLRSDRILQAMRDTGAQAVHPGYGFLSENHAFAQQCEDEGFEFIGPTPAAIKVMGLKTPSMKVAQDAGVSTAPRYDGNVETAEQAMELAPTIGFPIIMKASAGGGGMGMKVAWTQEEVADKFRDAKSEAMASFGDDTMLMQRFVCPNNGRHVEIQVLGDKHGNYLALPERECSVQRNHQKVIEEAPSPLLTPKMRAEMRAQAVALAAAVQYESAGTVEFLVDPDNMEWYFLEMNTRLQVEHPITEYITGIDLVEQMIRVAAGEPLAMKQEDIPMNGHSFEARIYAEDSAQNFRPGSGQLKCLKTPPESADVQVHTGVLEGDNVSVYYDPMISKLVTWGPDRPTALAKLKMALREYHIAGLTTNVEFCHAIADHPKFVAGDYDTTFIDEHIGELCPNVAVSPAKVAVAALAKKLSEEAAIRGAQQQSSDAGSPWAMGGDFRLNVPQSQTLALRDDAADTDFSVVMTSVPAEPGTYSVTVDGGTPMTITGTLAGDQLTVAIDGTMATIRAAVLDDGVHTFGSDGEAHLEVVAPAFLSAEDDTITSDFVLSPMDGSVTEVLVAPGDAVTEGQVIGQLFAMKMQTSLLAPRDGVIASVSVEAGDQVSINAVMFTLVEDEEEVPAEQVD